MKKALLLVSILFISVISTACINNFAVQELNNKAKAYLEQGDYQGAIERLKSSVDLDDSIFETHYNLAVAYTRAEDYPSAVECYKKAIELKPDFADAYYSLAVAQEDFANDLKNGIVKLDPEGKIIKQTCEEINASFEDKKADVPESTLTFANNLIKDAITNYENYLSKGTDLKDEQEVQDKIQSLKTAMAPNEVASSEVSE